mmetsp:Transcript_4893/g.6834  ORF Transcript_4893/g.6834 Transcript_4893/m.6834 type:complete len:122 (+) Transcript_4893:74-439(+)
MSERKAVIKNADMAEDMQQDAVDCASQALERYNIEKVLVFLHSSMTLKISALVLVKSGCETIPASIFRILSVLAPSFENLIPNFILFFPFHRTLPLLSRKSLTRSTTQHGTALWAGTLARM